MKREIDFTKPLRPAIEGYPVTAIGPQTHRQGKKITDDFNILILYGQTNQPTYIDKYGWNAAASQVLLPEELTPEQIIEEQMGRAAERLGKQLTDDVAELHKEVADLSDPIKKALGGTESIKKFLGEVLLPKLQLVEKVLSKADAAMGKAVGISLEEVQAEMGELEHRLDNLNGELLKGIRDELNAVPAKFGESLQQIMVLNGNAVSGINRHLKDVDGDLSEISKRFGGTEKIVTALAGLIKEETKRNMQHVDSLITGLRSEIGASERRIMAKIIGIDGLVQTQTDLLLEHQSRPVQAAAPEPAPAELPPTSEPVVAGPQTH